MGRALGFAPEAALEGLGLPLGGPGVEVVQLLGLQGFWQHQVLRGIGGPGGRKYHALGGYRNQYWPIHSHILFFFPPYSCLENCWSFNGPGPGGPESMIRK